MCSQSIECTKENLSVEGVPKNLSNVEPSIIRESWPKGDIRNFGKVNEKTVISHETLKSKLRERIENLKSTRDKGGVVPCISSRMSAGRLLDTLNGVNGIKLPECPKVNRTIPGQKKQKSGKLAIIGADVVSLFPSLKSVESAQLAKNAILASKVEFESVDYIKAMRYIYTVGGSELCSKAGLSRIMPHSWW